MCFFYESILLLEPKNKFADDDRIKDFYDLCVTHLIYCIFLFFRFINVAVGGKQPGFVGSQG
jgi:hypothetical protein